MMTLSKNMNWAQKAKKYTNAQLTRTANKAKDVIRISPLVCVYYLRYGKSIQTYTEEWGWIQQTAARARHFGCGNCGEKSAVAFVFLQDRRIIPIDYMERQNADHAFVVIGRKKDSKDSDWKTWGPNAVVCDPWDEKCYPAKEIPHRMYGGGKVQPRSLSRIG